MLTLWNPDVLLVGCLVTAFIWGVLLNHFLKRYPEDVEASWLTPIWVTLSSLIACIIGGSLFYFVVTRLFYSS